MALFENFPYTNLHELNLDWLINELKKIAETQVLSVNGMTGNVVLYEDANVILPEVSEAAWSFFRTADGVVRGITFGADGNAYIMNGGHIHEIYTSQNSVDWNDQYIQLGTLTDEELYNWNIFREVNGSLSGIQFDTDGTAYIMSGTDRFKIYSQHDAPPYPVTSIKDNPTGTPQTGNVVLYQDASVRFPDLDSGDPEEPFTFWNIFRYMNTGYYGIQFNSDGTMDLVTPGNVHSRIYTALNPPPYPVSSVNGQTGAVTLNIPPDFVVDLDEDIMDVGVDATGYTWGLVRVTNGEGGNSIGITFNNQAVPHAYLRYFDPVNEEYVSKQLLTNEDIPSGSGVLSVNGMTGAVNVYGTNIQRTNNTLETVEDGLNSLDNFAATEKTNLAFVAVNNNNAWYLPSGTDAVAGNYIIKNNVLGVALDAIVGGSTQIVENQNWAVITNGVLNALQSDIENRAPFAKISRTSATQYTFTVPSASKHLFVASAGGQRLWIGYIEAGQTGSITAVEIIHGSVFDSLDRTTPNQITFKWGSAGTGVSADFILNGNAMS